MLNSQEEWEKSIHARFAGKTVWVRFSGSHYHASHKCSHVDHDYYSATLELTKRGFPDLRNRSGDAYMPCPACVLQPLGAIETWMTRTVNTGNTSGKTSNW